MDLCSVFYFEWRQLRDGTYGREMIRRWYSSPVERELAMLRRDVLWQR